MVTKQVWLLVSLFFDRGRGEHESVQVLHLLVREDHPKLALDELSHLSAEEVSV